MGAVSAGLICGTGIRLVPALRSNAMGRLACALIAGLVFIAIALFRVPLAWTLLGIGLPAFFWALHRIRTLATAPQELA
jgi:chromate transporter